MFRVFLNSYSQFFENVNSCFEFLGNIDTYIHVEVLKLYPDAELPNFEVLEQTDSSLIMQYESKRSMADLAYGLMEAAAEHFKEPMDINMDIVKEDGSVVKFTLTKK